MTRFEAPVEPDEAEQTELEPEEETVEEESEELEEAEQEEPPELLPQPAPEDRRELTPPPRAPERFIDAETGELVHVPPKGLQTLFGTSNPVAVLARAKEHADVLADVIRQRNLYIVRNGKAYVLVDAWTLLGSMVGVYPIVVDVPEPVEVFGHQGFRATVEAVTRDGAIVSRASAFCLRDENLWGLEPTGKGGRKLDPRDLHALASMAQTRATSKALKQALGFIVQLAGYQTTPAEEMPAAA